MKISAKIVYLYIFVFFVNAIVHIVQTRERREELIIYRMSQNYLARIYEGVTE